jgi:hypothetical protein
VSPILKERNLNIKPKPAPILLKSVYLKFQKFYAFYLKYSNIKL